MQAQDLNDVLAMEGNLLPEIYELTKEFDALNVEIRVTNDLLKRPVFNDKGRPIIRYIYQETTPQYDRYKNETDVLKKYYFFMKTIYLMSKYRTYEDYVAAQGDSPRYKKLWDSNQDAYKAISEIVERVIDINEKTSTFNQYEFDDARIQARYEKSDYAAEEAKYEKVLVDINNLAADYIVYMYSNFYTKENAQMNILLSNERKYIISQLNDYLSIYPHIDSVKNIASMLVGSEDLNETYAFEAKIKYEVDKYDLCNNYGVTPKSYDAFMSKVQSEFDAYLRANPDTDINNAELIEDIKLKIYQENKDLLLKVPNFEEDYKAKNKLIYTSAFLLKYINAEMRFEEEIKESSTKVDSKTQTAVTRMYESLIDYQNKRFDRILNENIEINNTDEIEISKSVKSKQTDIEKLLAERKRLKEEKKRQSDEKSSQMQKMTPIKDNPSENIVQANLEHSRGVSEGLKEVSDENKKSDIVEKTDVISTKEGDSEFDNYSDMKYKQADPKILRDTNIPLSIRRLKYLESSRYSRSIYLPNSGYRVHVHKLKDEPKLTHMIDLINNIYTAEANYLVKYELLSIVYDSLSFDDFTSEPSFELFLDNLHDSDLTILFAMFALVNAPDSFKMKGDINFNITNVHCRECGSTLYLKHPLSLNLKTEFLKIYDKTTFSNDFPKYRSTLPTDIKTAYQNKFGKLHHIEVDDYITELTYKITYRLPSVAISLEIERMKYSLSYEIFKKTLTDNINANINVQPADLEFYDYIKDKSYNSVVDRYQELNKIDYTDDVYASLTGENLDEFKKLKSEYDLTIRLFDAINIITNRLNRLYSLMNYIYAISVFLKDPETNSLITDLDVIGSDNLLGIIECLSNLNDKSLQELINAIDDLNKHNKYNQELELEPSRLKGLLEWDKYFQTNENNMVISEEEFLNKIKEDNPNADLDVIRFIRQERKTNLENGYCVCGNEPLTLNYTQLLFFCLSKN